MRLATAIAKLLLRTTAAAAGLAARLLAGDDSPEAQGWRNYAEAIVASRHGDHQLALERMRAAADVLRDDPAVAVGLALAFANADRWDVAVDAAERTLKFYASAAEHPELWQMLAWGYLITGRYRAVIELMQRMQQADVSIGHIELPLMLARAMVWGHEPEVAHLRMLVKRTRAQLPAYLRFVEHLAKVRHDRTAILLLAALPPPAVVHAMDVMARRAAAAEEAEAVMWAARALEKLEIAPELSQAIGAVAAAMTGEKSRAMERAAEAEQLGPDQPLVQERLAAVYLALGDRAKALSCAAKAVMQGSRDALCAGLVASGLAKKGASAEARRVFATERVGDALGALVGHVVQARLYGEIGQAEDVKRLFELAREEMKDIPRWARSKALGEIVTENVAAAVRALGDDQTVGRLADELKQWAGALAQGSRQEQN